MKTMRNRYLTIMLGILMLMSIPSFTMAAANLAIDYVQDGSGVTINVTGPRDRPISISIKNESKYYYLDQGRLEANGALSFKTSLKPGETYDCIVNVDGQVVNQNIVMKTDSGPGPDVKDQASIFIKGYKGVVLDQSSVEIKAGESAWDFTTRLLDENNIDYDNSGGYFSMIAGQREFDQGKDSGWMFSVSGSYPNVGASGVQVRDGDTIEWLYTYDLGDDIGAPSGGGGNLIVEEVVKEPLEDMLKELAGQEVSQENLIQARENMTRTLASISKLKDQETINKRIDDLLDISSKIEAQQGKAHQNINKKVEKTVGIKLPEEGSKNPNTTLPAELFQRASMKEINKIKIESNLLSFEMAPDFLANKLKESISITIGNEDGIKSIQLRQGSQLLKKVEKPIKVTLPYDDKVVNKNNLTVEVLKDNGTREIIGGIYDEASKTMTFLTNTMGKYTVRDNPVTFKDVANYQWAEESISRMAAKGIIVGKEKDNFDPGASISRAEFSALIVRALKLNDDIDKNLPFQDVKQDHWYYKSILAVYENGLASGKSATSFDPKGKISREEIATIMGQVLKNNMYKDQDISNLTQFKDMDHISKWAQQGAAIAVHNKLIGGTDDGLMPKKDATRAETAVMLDRLYGLIMD